MVCKRLLEEERGEGGFLKCRFCKSSYACVKGKKRIPRYPAICIHGGRAKVALLACAPRNEINMADFTRVISTKARS